MLANRAAPPNRAPIPTAAVCLGPKLSEAEPEADEAASLALRLALEAALPADSVAEEAASAAELVRPASSEDREEAAEPVAVDMTELRVWRRVFGLESGHVNCGL